MNYLLGEDEVYVNIKQCLDVSQHSLPAIFLFTRSFENRKMKCYYLSLNVTVYPDWVEWFKWKDKSRKIVLPSMFEGLNISLSNVWHF